jgi:hypothetical protein
MYGCIGIHPYVNFQPIVATYAWESAVLKAVLKPDNALLPSRIAAARSILADRLASSEKIGAEERAEAENALERLGILQEERCPDGLT